MGGFGCVPAVRDVGLLVGCIYGHGRLVWVEQSDPDGKLILNSPVGSSAVPSSSISPPSAVGPKSTGWWPCPGPVPPQWRMLALRLLRASVRGAVPTDDLFAGADSCCGVIDINVRAERGLLYTIPRLGAPTLIPITLVWTRGHWCEFSPAS